MPQASTSTGRPFESGRVGRARHGATTSSRLSSPVSTRFPNPMARKLSGVTSGGPRPSVPATDHVDAQTCARRACRPDVVDDRRAVGERGNRIGPPCVNKTSVMCETTWRFAEEAAPVESFAGAFRHGMA
ncbi:hypothetical protein B4N89_46955 [Embleya scabrispora]|uniref:Uncharacterized protein n=1 Tax=Embleya scabrispora TaxID=159449 RepID=A0A1T3NI98_9ACTN|nr:hypothetical protein B4N89_46955 [Embleya scabrispora]